MSRGIAADIVTAAAFYSLRKYEILGHTEDKVIRLGLRSLAIALATLHVVHHALTDIGYNTNLGPQDSDREILCDDVAQLRLSIDQFIGTMQEFASQTSSSADIPNQLTNFYGILLMFLIRAALRSAFRYSEYGLQPAFDQEHQDDTFIWGLRCPLYQPNLSVLTASKMTIAETRPSGARDERKDKQEKWLSIQCQRAAKLLAMPDGLNKTLAEHLEYSIDRWLNQ